MGLDHVRAEIARLRVRVRRQHQDIASLQRAGIGSTSAIALLERIQDSVDALGSERDRLNGQERMKRQPAYASGKLIKGTPSHRRGL